MGFDLLPRRPARAPGPFHFNNAGWQRLMDSPVGVVIGTQPAQEPGRYHFAPDRKRRSPRRNEGYYVTAPQARAMAAVMREWIGSKTRAPGE